MIEQILRPQNLQKALQQVIANKGSAGIDGLKTVELKAYMQKHKGALLETVKAVSYTHLDVYKRQPKRRSCRQTS